MRFGSRYTYGSNGWYGFGSCQWYDNETRDTGHGTRDTRHETRDTRHEIRVYLSGSLAY
jgi:hypothetical protein